MGGACLTFIRFPKSPAERGQRTQSCIIQENLSNLRDITKAGRALDMGSKVQTFVKNI